MAEKKERISPNPGKPGYYICDAHGMISARQGGSIGFISGYAWLAVLQEEKKLQYFSLPFRRPCGGLYTMKRKRRIRENRPEW